MHKKYAGIFSRCNNHGCLSYIRYGGKGVRCKFKSYTEFSDWAFSCGLPNIPFEVHRIDNDGHYEPGNIEFLTKEEHKKRHYFKELI